MPLAPGRTHSCRSVESSVAWWSVTRSGVSPSRCSARPGGWPRLVPVHYVLASQWWRDCLDIIGIRRVLGEVIRRLRTESVPRVGVLGYSMGGAFALWAATALDVDAAVSFYRGGLVDPYWPDMAAGIAGAATIRAVARFLRCRRPANPARRHPAAARRARWREQAGMAVVFDGLRHGLALDDTDPRHAPDEAASAWRNGLALLRESRDC